MIILDGKVISCTEELITEFENNDIASDYYTDYGFEYIFTHYGIVDDIQTILNDCEEMEIYDFEDEYECYCTFEDYLFEVGAIKDWHDELKDEENHLENWRKYLISVADSRDGISAVWLDNGNVMVINTRWRGLY